MLRPRARAGRLVAGGSAGRHLAPRDRRAVEGDDEHPQHQFRQRQSGAQARRRLRAGEAQSGRGCNRRGHVQSSVVQRETLVRVNNCDSVTLLPIGGVTVTFTRTKSPAGATVCPRGRTPLVTVTLRV